MALIHTKLTDEQKVLPSGAVIPSGEANFYDTSQDFGLNNGYGINVPFVDNPSGVIKTYGPDGSVIEKDSVFSANGLNIPFSNAQAIAFYQITDFAIFNDYIHYETDINGAFVSIPYLSTYKVAPKFDPYAPILPSISTVR